MLAEAGGQLVPVHETCREHESAVDPKYLDQIRPEAKEFSTHRLHRQSRLAEAAIGKFKNGKNSIRPRTFRRLIGAIHDLQNKGMKNRND